MFKNTMTTKTMMMRRRRRMKRRMQRSMSIAGMRMTILTVVRMEITTQTPPTISRWREPRLQGNLQRHHRATVIIIQGALGIRNSN
jgi:hypothetical protein